MKTIEDVMAESRIEKITVNCGSTVQEAVEKLSRNGHGALLVLNNNKLVGIFSERDLARKIVLKDLDPSVTIISKVMTKNVVCVTPEQSAEECLEIMYKEKFRHLPVITKDQQIVGFLSVLDIVHALLEEKTQIVTHLKDYVSEVWPI